MKIDYIKLKDLAREYDISALYIFGSFARGDFKEGSDIDLLVKFKQSPGFIEFIRLEDKLTQLFGTKVDLVTESALSKHIRSSVLKEIKEIYCER